MHPYTQQPKPAGPQPLQQRRVLCPHCLLSTLEGLSQLALGQARQRQPGALPGGSLEGLWGPSTATCMPGGVLRGALKAQRHEGRLAPGRDVDIDMGRLVAKEAESGMVPGVGSQGQGAGI